MGMEVTEICMEKEPDCVIIFSNGVSDDSSHETISHHDEEPNDRINGNLRPILLQNKAETEESGLKEGTTENSVEVAEPILVETCREDQDVLDLKCEVVLPEEKMKPATPKSKDDTKKTIPLMKSSTKSSNGNVKTKYTVPQPFALATEKRALCGIRPVGTEPDMGTPVTKLSQSNNLKTPVAKKQNEQISPSVTRKPLQPDNKKHPDEDDSCSVASSTAASAITIKPKGTFASAPVFRCSTRAERRKEFYSKLEEKHQALEAEKTQWEARTKEEKEAAVKQLRKSLMFKANPMPSFYHEGPPPKVELKKAPPTRAKSPKLGRRKSCSDTSPLEKGLGASGRGTRHSLGIYKDSTTTNTTVKDNHINVQSGNSSCKFKEESKETSGANDLISVEMNVKGKVDVIDVQS